MTEQAKASTAGTLSSIRNRAMIIALQFSKPQLSAQDAKATADAERANGATGSLQTSKNLYPKHLIKPILEIEAEARKYLRSRSSMAIIDGLYLINSTLLMEVLPTLADYEVARKQAVTVFAQNWTQVIHEAQVSQGALFDPSLYPDVSDVINQFTMHTRMLPVGDLGGGLFDEIEEEIREQVTESVTEVVEDTTRAMMAGAIAEPLSRLVDIVANVYDKTSRDDGRLYTSVLDQLNEVTELMPQLNVLGLPQLDQLAAHCKEAFNVPIEELKRKDSSARERAAASAKEVLVAVGLDPVAAQNASQQERKELSKKAADDVLAQMSGIF